MVDGGLPAAHGRWRLDGAISTVNLLLWPDLRSQDDVRLLVHSIAPRFSGLDATLWLRVDPLTDPALPQVHQWRTAQPTTVRYGLVVGEMTTVDIASLHQTMDGVLALPSTRLDVRAAFLTLTGAPLMQLLPRQGVLSAPSS